MPLPVEKIGEWTVTQLVKFIKDILENQPPRNLPTAVVGDAVVTSSLTMKGKLSFPTDPNFHIFGATGEPAFQNSWIAWGAPYYPPGYWLDPLGFVHLRGTIKSGVIGSAAAQLPPGLWPASTAGPFIVLSNGIAGRVDITDTGLIIPQSPSNNTYVVLDGIYFRLT